MKIILEKHFMTVSLDIWTTQMMTFIYTSQSDD